MSFKKIRTSECVLSDRDHYLTLRHSVLGQSTLDKTVLPSARGGGAGTGSNSTEGHIGYLFFSSAQAARGNKD